MSQTLRGRVIRTENIAVAQVCGTEMAVAVGVAAPAPPIEAVTMGMNPAYDVKVKRDGAVDYWRLNDVSGQALDSVGAFPGTLVGGVTRNQQGPMPNGRAMYFDGNAGTRIDCGNMVLTAPFTVEAWFNQGPSPIIGGGYPVLRIFGNAEVTTEIGLIVGTYQNKVILRTQSSQGGDFGSGVFGLGPYIGDNQWHHAAWVVLAGVDPAVTCRVYVDGQLIGQANSKYTSKTPCYIGACPFIAANPEIWVGLISEVAIYNQVLSAAVIYDHYTRSNSPYGLENIQVGVQPPNPEVP